MVHNEREGKQRDLFNQHENDLLTESNESNKSTELYKWVSL